MLFDHDCVIIPSLGGFLASNQPARILIPNQVIFPPYRRIAFNVYLKQNDGLLANYLVETDNISYAEAMRNIESFTTMCFTTMDNGRKVNLEEIGSLYFDREKNIQFEAFRNFNHLKESFGLDAIHFLPIRREEEAVNKKNITEKVNRPSVAPRDRNKFIIKRNKRIIGAALLLGGIVWFSMNLYFVAPKNYEATSLNPFDSQETAFNKIDSLNDLASGNLKSNDTLLSDIVIPMVPHDTVNSQETITDDTDVALNVRKPDVPEDIIKETDKLETEKQELKQDQETIRNKSYLISGVFKIRDNAVSQVTKLKQMGFSNARIIEANDMNYVAYDSFSNNSEARALLDSLHDKKMESWIWKY